MRIKISNDDTIEKLIVILGEKTLKEYMEVIDFFDYPTMIELRRVYIQMLKYYENGNYKNVNKILKEFKSFCIGAMSVFQVDNELHEMITDTMMKREDIYIGLE